MLLALRSDEQFPAKFKKNAIQERDMLIQIATLSVPTLLLLLLLVPRSVANDKVVTFRKLITSCLALQLLFAAVSFAWLLTQNGADPLAAGDSLAARFSDSLCHYDGVSGLMFLLVSFVGLVVCRFSIRYLNGDPQQGGYFAWLGFTLGAVSLLVLAGNLVLFFAAWVMTSFGLHHLLLHYKERPWARRAAWTKFAISRIGDVFLLTALVLVYFEFGSYHLADILAQAREITDPSWTLSFIGWFLMLGAVTKSAQFPVHFWLPETMEAPTPVSALMHAGIVNAGGYLLVRWSPVVVHSPAAMGTLAVIGGFTAVFAGLVMMTQANVKRALGYSTVAQMGFMMLQCGLGVFSAAMLHIIAHSLYKAHAFLRTGDAWRVEQVPTMPPSRMPGHDPTALGRQFVLGFTLLLSAGIVVLVANGLSLDVASKGGIALVAILCVAFASWFAKAYDISWRAVANTAVVASLLLTAYLVSYSLINELIYPFVPKTNPGVLAAWAGMVIVSLFAAVATLQTIISESSRHPRLRALYVHISNGLYVDTIIRRFLGLSLSRTPSAS